MAETGIVTAVNGQMVEITMKRSDACAKCGACISFADNSAMRLTAKNCCKAVTGDVVEISLESGRFLSAVFLLYGIPLIAFLASILISSLFLRSEPLCLLIALAVTALSWLAVHLYSGKMNRGRYLPKAVNVVRKEES